MTREKLYPTTLLIFIAVLVLNACGVIEQYNRNYEEAAETYRPPENLNVNVQNVGLLLVDAVTKQALNTMALSGVAIINTDNPEKMILSGSFKKGGFLSQISGVVVFPDLKPGRYRIVKIKTENVNIWETRYMPTTKEFEIQISVSRPAYFGQIEVKHSFGSTDQKIKYDKAREVESWEMVIAKYGKSPWTETIKERINGLQ